MKHNFFITGGAGFIGSHLIERLIKRGQKIKIFDNLTRNAIKFTEALDHPNVEFVNGDILDSAKLSKEMSGSDIVIHLAAIAGVSNYYKFPAKTLKTNLIGTYNVLEAMIANNISRLIEMSTSEVFGTEVVDVTENGYLRVGPPHEKRWSYACSKIGGEQLIYRYSEEFDWNSTIVRPFNIYGPRQIGEGAISNFCKKVIAKEKIQIEGTGSSMRSWCYISDFLEALMLLIEKPHEKIECFNIGNSWDSMANLLLAEMIVKFNNELTDGALKESIEFVPMSYTDIKVRYPNTSKMYELYNWKPKVNLEEGVMQTYKWFLNYYKKD